MDQKPTFRNALKEFVEATLDTSIDKLSTVQQSKIMTRFYIEEVVRRLVPGIVPEDQEDYEACMIDGGNDCGVDFLVRRDGRVFIVQAKYHAKKYTEEADPFSHFADVLKRLVPSAKDYKRNEKLSDAIEDIDWENDTFDLHYVNLGKAADNVRAREKQGVSGVPGLPDADDRTELQLLDESDLNIRYREALSAGEAIMEQVPVLFWANAGQPPWLTFTNQAGRVSYVGRIAGSQLAELYNHHRYKLFAMNIRDYVGDTSTNKGIIETAVDAPDDFFFFNNGISAVATKIEPDVSKNELFCQRLSIVNGAQTVRSIAKAQKRSADGVRDVSVMVRISQFALNAAGEQSFLDSITRFNNTQNSIKVSDFRSNDPVQMELAHRFEKLTRGGKRFWYKNKRVAKQDASRIAIGMEEFAKTVFAFKLGPDDIYGGTKFLFDTNPDGGYRLLFGDANGVWDTLTDEEFKLLAGSWFVCEHVRTVWNKEKERRLAEGLPETKNALERRWMVYFVVGELLREVYRQIGADLDSEIRRLSKPGWMLEDGVEARSVEKYTRLACSVLIKAYRSASKGADFSHRNWFREKATLLDIRQEIPSELQTLKMILDSGELPTLSSAKAGKA